MHEIHLKIKTKDASIYGYKTCSRKILNIWVVIIFLFFLLSYFISILFISDCFFKYWRKLNIKISSYIYLIAFFWNTPLVSIYKDLLKCTLFPFIENRIGGSIMYSVILFDFHINKNTICIMKTILNSNESNYIGSMLLYGSDLFMLIHILM